MNTPTPHNAAHAGQIAPTVLFCGDPNRAAMIAEQYLEQAVCYSRTRGMLGFTGLYRGVRVSVQAHGMGIPSVCIYAHELFQFYGVQRIIRVGSAGGLRPEVLVGDVVVASAACTNSAYVKDAPLPGAFAPTASHALLEGALSFLREGSCRFHVGSVLSDDVFYHAADAPDPWGAMGVLAVEMEAAGLYYEAARAGRQALCLLTVTASLDGGDAQQAADPQPLYHGAIHAALELAHTYGE